MSQGKRAPNFSREEKLLLCEAMAAFTHIIEGKKTDFIKNSQKQQAWLKITEMFNAKTKSIPRTVENLIACYRNMKNKIKKEQSEVDLEDIKEAVNKSAIEENSNEWEGISNNSYEELKKRVIMGGGLSPPNNDALDRRKLIIKSEIDDDPYNIYEGDASLLNKFQDSQREEDRTLPSDNRCNKHFVVPIIEHNVDDDMETMTGDEKKTKTADETIWKKKNVKESFLKLSEAKQELIALRKRSLELDIIHKTKKHKLEVENVILENRHKEEIRKKELLLMDIRIKKERDS